MPTSQRQTRCELHVFEAIVVVYMPRDAAVSLKPQCAKWYKPRHDGRAGWQGRTLLALQLLQCAAVGVLLELIQLRLNRRCPAPGLHQLA